MPPPPVIGDELATFLQSGLSIAIGTRDADLAPEGACVWAVRVAPDRAHLEAFVYAASAGPTLANLEVSPLMALVFDRPHDHRACQIKGHLVDHRPARDDELALVEGQLAGFCRSLIAIGFPGVEYQKSARIWPAHVLRMRMTDVFCQDPGPGAGERMTADWKVP